MTKLSKICSIVSELIPINYLDNLSIAVSSDYQFLEVLVYELSFNINKETYKTIIKVFDLIFEQAPHLKSILIKSVSHYSFINESHYAVYDYFKIQYKRNKLDKYDKLIAENNMNELRVLELSSRMIEQMRFKAIEQENIEYFKYLFLSYSNEAISKNVIKCAINVGNNEIIRMLIGAGYDLSTVDMQYFRDSHNFNLMAFMTQHNCYSYENDGKLTENLFFRVVSHSRFENLAIDFDLSTIQDNSSTQANITRMIKNDCINMICHCDFAFDINHLIAAMLHDKKEIFNFILEKVIITNEYGTVSKMNVLQVAILTGSIEYVTAIFKKNNLLILDEDINRNNVLHMCMRQNSIEVFEFIINNLSDENLKNKLQTMNKLNETPLYMLIKFNHKEYAKLISNRIKLI